MKETCQKFKVFVEFTINMWTGQNKCNVCFSMLLLLLLQCTVCYTVYWLCTLSIFLSLFWWWCWWWWVCAGQQTKQIIIIFALLCVCLFSFYYFHFKMEMNLPLQTVCSVTIDKIQHLSFSVDIQIWTYLFINKYAYRLWLI